jgi:hypothetical protein
MLLKVKSLSVTLTGDLSTGAFRTAYKRAAS